MKRRTQPAARLVLIAVVAVCALSAGTALAGCVEDGEAGYQNCIEGVANYYGEVPPFAEAVCAGMAANAVNACLQKPPPGYLVCYELYTFILVENEQGVIVDILFVWHQPLVCQ